MHKYLLHNDRIVDAGSILLSPGQVGLLSGWGVFALGRNHPTVVEVLNDVLHGGLPHLVQMDVTVLAGLLAERLVAKMPPGLEKVFFCNSGAEAVEAALKFARYSTKRTKFVYVERGYHGLTYGPLSINGMDEFRDGFGRGDQYMLLNGLQGSVMGCIDGNAIVILGVDRTEEAQKVLAQNWVNTLGPEAYNL